MIQMAKLNDAVQRFLGGNNPRMKVNLKKIFDVDLSRFPSLKQAVGQEILDIIKDRTQKKSKSWEGDAFPKYSKEYKNSLAFKAFGKTNKVNLTLTGDMLELMDFDDEGNVLHVGWDDSNEAAKAHGHITGNIAKKKSQGKRDFFGLSQEDIEKVRRKFQDAVDRNSQALSPTDQNFVNEALALLNRLREEESGQG